MHNRKPDLTNKHVYVVPSMYAIFSKKTLFNFFKFWRPSVTNNCETHIPSSLFNVGCKFVCSFLASTTWRRFLRLGTKLSQHDLSKSNTFGIFVKIIFVSIIFVTDERCRNMTNRLKQMYFPSTPARPFYARVAFTFAKTTFCNY